MNRTGNLCICILCLVLLVGTASAATTLTNFVAKCTAWQPTNSLMPIIANRVIEPSFERFAVMYTINEENVIPVEAPVHIPHNEEKIAIMAVRQR